MQQLTKRGALPGVVWQSRTALRGRPTARVLKIEHTDGGHHFALFVGPAPKASGDNAQALIDYAVAELCG